MSTLQGKVAITAALNGPRLHRGTCATVPYTPSEVAAEAQRAVNAGAAIVHFTARESGGAATHRVEAVQETLAAVRAACAAKTSITTVLPTAAHHDRLSLLDAQPDIVMIGMGCTTTAKFNYSRRSFEYESVDGGSFSDSVQLLERARALRITPMLLCNDLGQVEALTSFSAMDLLPESSEVLLQFGKIGTASVLVRNLVHISSAVPPQLRWTSAVHSVNPWPFLASAIAAGGHIRVGLEDCRYTPDGSTAESNARLVEAAVNVIRAIGLEPATAEDLGQTPEAT